jgi:hypothetical protein
VLLTRYCRRFTLYRSDFLVSHRTWACVHSLFSQFDYWNLCNKKKKILTVYLPVKDHKTTIRSIVSAHDSKCICENVYVCSTERQILFVLVMNSAFYHNNISSSWLALSLSVLFIPSVLPPKIQLSLLLTTVSECD